MEKRTANVSFTGLELKLRVALALFLSAIIASILWLRNIDGDFDWRLPSDMPRPAVPRDNPMSKAKVELGRWLFYDTRLSGNNTMSCGTCHKQSLAFTDGRVRSVGSTGIEHPRSSMSLVNAAYASRLTWANPLLDRLEEQALTPLFGDSPVEMGLGGRESKVGELLRTEPHYAELAREAFGNDENPYSVLNGVRAIAAFVRTILSFDSRYDRYLAGQINALTATEIRGMELFFSERLECFHCHGGFNFTDSTTHENAAVESVGFHNTGLYNLDGNGAYPTTNTGLYDMTGIARDMGRFKAPTLRNIAVTAPYMHDGSIATLDKVLDHYARGGRLTGDGQLSGDGRLSPFKSEFIGGFELTETERADLIAFLQSLTDIAVLTEERWSDPFAD